MFKLEFKTDNAAFGDDLEFEVFRVLGRTAERVINQHAREGKIFDVSGNTIGHFELTED